MKDTIGFVGLGNMGSGMASNLAGSGISVLAFDVDPTKSHGIKTDNFKSASTVKEIAEQCETVIICLPHPDISQQVIFGELLARGSTVKNIIETSTLTPEVVLDFAVSCLR